MLRRQSRRRSRKCRRRASSGRGADSTECGTPIPVPTPRAPRTPGSNRVRAHAEVGTAAAPALPRSAARCGLRQGAARHLDFRVLRAARQIFDRVPVQVAGRKVERPVAAAFAQQFVDQTHALEEFGPIDRRDEPQTGDDVAHAHVDRALALMLAVNDVVRGGALRGKGPMQPGQRPAWSRDRGRAAAETAARRMHWAGSVPSKARNDGDVGRRPRRRRPPATRRPGRPPARAAPAERRCRPPDGSGFRSAPPAA